MKNKLEPVIVKLDRKGALFYEIMDRESKGYHLCGSKGLKLLDLRETEW